MVCVGCVYCLCACGLCAVCCVFSVCMCLWCGVVGGWKYMALRTALALKFRSSIGGLVYYDVEPR